MKTSQRFWRGLFFLLLITALCGGLALPIVEGDPAYAAPQAQAATNVIISEFATRGIGGVYDEFVELYNPITNSPVDISGWTIQKSSGCGTTIIILETIPAGVSLNPGQHYLAAGFSYTGTVVPDYRHPSNWSLEDNGGIALLDSSAGIVDQVGMCATTTYLEGTPLLPLSGTLDQSYERQLDVSNSCIDATNNSTDFFILQPSDPQNLSSPLTACGNATPTLTPTSTFTFTNTPTSTATVTNTSTPTNTGVPGTSLSVLINEVAWAGTAASTSDEWIELYNPGSNPIDLTGWTLRTDETSPSVNISLNGLTIDGGEFLLLERSADDLTVSDIDADLLYTGDLGNSNEILRLRDASGNVIDTANSNGGNWPAGSNSTFGTMERRGVIPDSDFAWITNTGVVRNGRDANGNPINGTPKNANWAVSVTPTFSPTPTRTRTPTPTRTPSRVPTKVITRTFTPAPPPPLVAINEFVPRPAHDWNHDGVVNTSDEYIELLNHGVIDVNLSGYSLDDEVNIGSSPFRLPSVTLKPGERIVFFGSQTNLLLSDGGDGVRLLKPNGQLGDAYNYSVVRFPDESFCRLPDNGGLDDWNQFCFPTPGLPNSQSDNAVNAPTTGGDELLCPISDTLPEDFMYAECMPFGSNIWNPVYWDRNGWLNQQELLHSPGKWPLFAD